MERADRRERKGGHRSVQAFEVASEADIQDVLERVEQVLEGRTRTPSTERRRYLDTFDRRIRRSGGWLCELAGRSPMTLFWSANGKEPVSATTRRTPEFAHDLPPGSLREDLERVVAPRRLLPIAEVLRTTRTVELLDDEGKIVCRVRAVTSELTGAHIAEPVHRIFLEGVRGYDDEHQTVDRFLRYQLRLAVSEAREVDEVFEALGQEAGRNPSALDLELSPRMTAGEAVRLVLATLCDVMLVNRPGILEDLDTEFLHDFRVALRRTRSVLSQVGDVLPRAVAEHYRREFRWLGDLTGGPRDLDVLQLNLTDYRSELPAQDASALEPLEALVRKDRRRAQKVLERELRSERFERLVSNWRSFLLEPAGTSQASASTLSTRPVLELTGRRTWKRYRKVRRLGRKVGDETPASEMHALRIHCKKLRYLLEVFGSLHPAQEIDACVKELKRLQNTLGELNDARVHAGMLRELADRMGGAKEAPAEPLVAIGMVVSNLADRRDRERVRFAKRFERFDSDENHARFRKLFKEREA